MTGKPRHPTEWMRRRARTHGPAVWLWMIATVLLVVPVERVGFVGPEFGAAQVPIDIEAGASREVLSGGRDPWEEYWVRATIRPAPGAFVYGGVRHTSRFGEDDRQIEAGAGLPLADRWSLRLDGTWSATHRVVPHWGASGTLSYRFAPGWSLSGGGGREVWESTAVNRQHVGVDRRFDSFSVAYRLGLHQIEAGGSGVRHGLSGGWSYGGRGSSVTLALGGGRAATVVGAGDLRSTTERSARISGVHWLDDRTGIAYSFGIHRHGPFFTRNTSSVGFRRRF